MASIRDYGLLDYPKLDSYSHSHITIDTIMGILQFPIVEKQTYDDGVVINVYEKKLFGRKHRGYLSLLYIDDFRADESNFVFKANTPIPDNLDILLGLDFKCDYKEYYVHEQFKIFKLGQSRKELISYGLLKHLVNIDNAATIALSTEQFESNPVPSATSFAPTMMVNVASLKGLLNFFQKFER